MSFMAPTRLANAMVDELVDAQAAILRSRFHQSLLRRAIPATERAPLVVTSPDVLEQAARATKRTAKARDCPAAQSDQASMGKGGPVVRKLVSSMSRLREQCQHDANEQGAKGGEPRSVEIIATSSMESMPTLQAGECQSARAHLLGGARTIGVPPKAGPPQDV
jgi:hypothetical protein